MRNLLNRFLAFAGATAIALGTSGQIAECGTKAVSPVAQAAREAALRVKDKSAGNVPNLLLWQMERNRRQSAARGSLRHPATGNRPLISLAAHPQRGSMRSLAAGVAGQGVELPPIYAHVEYWDGFDQDADQTFLTRIPGVSGAEPERLTTALNEFTYGGVIKDNVYYSTGVYQFMGEVFVMNKGVDMDTYEVVYNHASGSVNTIPVATTYCPADGKIYGIFYNETLTGYIFGTITYDEEGGHTSPISSISGNNWCALASTAGGDLYAITMEREGTEEDSRTVGSHLLKVDRATGATTTVGSTGQLPYYESAATIDPESGKMYWSVSPADNSGYLTEVNLTTGQATKILDLWGNAQMVGLAVGKPLAEPKAPAAVTDLRLDFPKGALKGKVRFTAPTTHFDGTPATGQLSYRLMVNGEQKGSGTTTCGAETAVDVTVATDATYLFELTISNSTGDSPVAKLEGYIGVDQPKGPANVRLVYEDGMMKLSWDAVTEGMSGGYVDPEGIVYMVNRISPTYYPLMPTSELTATETVAEPVSLQRYSYLVAANYNGASSPATRSNTIVLGPIVPPYTDGFGAADALDLYTVADANNDGVTWEKEEGTLTVGYNNRLAMDDWLITPKVKVEAGKSYEISMKAWIKGARYFERLEVKYGNSADPSALTGTVIAPTEIKTGADAPEMLTGTLRAAADGYVYIGVHGISDADRLGLYIDDLTISDGVADGAPDVVTGLKATGDPNGALKVTLDFNAPARSIDGNALTSLEKIEITRDGDLIGTIPSPAAGSAQSFTDNLDATGTYHYAVTAYNAAGKGKTEKIDAFCGLDIPGAPQNVEMTENPSKPGEVTVSWDAVAVDHKGNPISSALITYSVYAITDDYRRTPVVEGIRDTEYTLQAVAPGDQDFVQYCVFAYTNEGESDGTMTPLLAVGTPYEGLWESFAGGDMSYIFGTDGEDSAYWDIYPDQSMLASQDGDNGFAALSGKYTGESADLISGKISLAGMTNPALTFWVYTVADDDSNILEIYINEAGGEPVLAKKNVSNQGATGWNRVVVPLDRYAGKVVQVTMRGTLDAYGLLAVDNIKVGPLYAKDLMAQSLSVPERVNAGKDFSVDVTVVNEGLEAMDGARVTLYADGEAVAEEDCPPLRAGGMSTVTFARTMHPLAEEAVSFHAMVAHADDINASNNTTGVAEVHPVVSRLPEPTALEGKLSEEKGAALSWTAPDLSGGVNEMVTESFESGEAFAHSYEGWTFVDADGHPVGGFVNQDIPGITPNVTTASFFVFDSGDDYPEFNSTYAAHSGDRFLAALFSYQDFTTNDWAISPRLSGEAQTISFYARSYAEDYPEKIEMLYSRGGKELEEFTAVKSVAQVPEGWTLYEFEVPEGATYFAVRSCATASFMLMLDDFTFIPDESIMPVLKGYNVYRNGERLTAQPVAPQAYTDLAGPNAENAYRVTAVYDRGESRGSNEVRVATSGLDGTVMEGVGVYGARGAVVIRGAEGMKVTVAATDGKTVYGAVAASDEMTIPVAPGVYVVKAGNTVAKVNVN